ncbi:hypothetical protein Tco_0344436 [Tanacetum coccineum]
MSWMVAVLGRQPEFWRDDCSLVISYLISGRQVGLGPSGVTWEDGEGRSAAVTATGSVVGWEGGLVVWMKLEGGGAQASGLWWGRTLLSVHSTCNSGDENLFTYDSKLNYVNDSPNVFNHPPQSSLNSCEFCGNDALCTGVENLVPILSKFKGISEDTYDVPVYEDPSTFDALGNHSEILSDFNNDGTSSDDDSYENIEYIEASPFNLEIISLEEVNDVDRNIKDEF